MSRFLSMLISIVFAAAAAWAQTARLVSVASDGWTVTADSEQAVLTVAHGELGTIIKDARLNLEGVRGLGPLKSWSVEKLGEDQLSIKTGQPRTHWVFKLSPNTLEISSTSAEGVITAQAPATADRLVARLVDPAGVPVTWVGTNEVVGTYGGSETRNPSYLPRRNPEVMYFSLGQVSSRNLHSLFDRRLDIAIQFSDDTVMKRDSRNSDLLDLKLPVPGNTLVRVIPDYFTKTLGVPYFVPFDDSYFSRPPMVWGSWTSYYDQVKEEDIVRNADWIAAHLKPYGFQYVQLDDGYDRGKNGEHYWIENWDREKFPHGPKWLADYIKSKGLHAGLWIVPNAYAGAVEQHPDWYLHFMDGRIVKDYNTPALDSTNPDVLDFLKKEFTTLDEWGFEYYKFDGEHAIPKYAPGVDLDRLYDKSLDPLEAYRRRLKLIRDAIGPERFIEGCPAGTPLNGIGYFNSYFNGADLYNSFQGMYALFSSINANAFLNHLLVYVMPGEGMELNPPMSVAEAEKKRDSHVVETARTREEPMRGFGTTLAEAHTVVSYVALTGVAYPVASVMPELPEERVQLLKKTLPTMPILPVDLFSRGSDMQWDIFKHTTTDDYIHNYPEILDLKVNTKSRVYDVVGLTNWRSWKTSRELSFVDKLGLDPDASFVVFDFWAQKILGVFKDRMDVEIEPHDTRVLFIHPLSNHPQLVGISRHISGTYSIESLAWNAAGNTLRGSSQTVAGDPYTLWIYVPQGFRVAQVRAAAPGREVTTSRELSGDSLRVSFEGRPEAVDWEVKFAAAAAD
jgi:melibiase-like protein/alpha galactosidase C-like protein